MIVCIAETQVISNLEACTLLFQEFKMVHILLREEPMCILEYCFIIYSKRKHRVIREPGYNVAYGTMHLFLVQELLMYHGTCW